jgi:hypothetical protein
VTTVETIQEHTIEQEKSSPRRNRHGAFLVGLLGAGLAIGSLFYIGHHHSKPEAAVTSVTLNDEVLTYIDKSEVIAATLGSLGIAATTIAAGLIATEVSKDEL